ncbi:MULTISPECIES: hypothetical protein [Sphingobium]|uniref:hypothetical protein n=1 Tax=Sphingobium TaxID=165695 RepID=UPI00159C147A|nr:hypothetical protein [Sphingobium sp. 15-1]
MPTFAETSVPVDSDRLQGLAKGFAHGNQMLSCPFRLGQDLHFDGKERLIG